MAATAAVFRSSIITACGVCQRTFTAVGLADCNMKRTTAPDGTVFLQGSCPICGSCVAAVERDGRLCSYEERIKLEAANGIEASAASSFAIARATVADSDPGVDLTTATSSFKAAGKRLTDSMPQSSVTTTVDTAARYAVRASMERIAGKMGSTKLAEMRARYQAVAGNGKKVTDEDIMRAFARDLVQHFGKLATGKTIERDDLYVSIQEAELAIGEVKEAFGLGAVAK